MAGNAGTVYADLQKLGLPAGAAAGVVGNLVIESGVNPAAVGDHGTSHGIAQWHNGRWTNLLNWARQTKSNPADLATQEGYLVTELQSSGLWSKLQATPDATAAATLVMTDYERPASKDPRARVQAALNVLNGQDALTSTPGAAGASSGATAGSTGSSGGSWTDNLVSGFRSAAYTVTGATLGLALVGAGVVIFAKGRHG